ncbi:hypothetical protein L218DRAFT_1082510 [Marasmius fiardii PR-910]|nr:hypothetical protein L218DRAFT_1082510 [Marasmius fiardii PR-910]
MRIKDTDGLKTETKKVEPGVVKNTTLNRSITPFDKERPQSQSTAQPHTENKPTNYISINKRLPGPVDCTYILDPTLQILPSLLPPLELGQTEEDRKNLSLKIQKVGIITANIFLLHREGSLSAKRTTLEFQTGVGKIELKIDTTPSPNRPPFWLKATTHLGNVSLKLPRTFRGLLTITTDDFHGDVLLSPEVSMVNRWLSTEDIVSPTGRSGQLRRGFVGDMSMSGDGEPELWNGDEVVIEIESVGKVDISFVSVVPQ